MENRKDIPTRARFALAGMLLAACPLLMLLFSHLDTRPFPAYRHFSKAWLTLLSTITGWVPFALWDILLLAFAVIAVVVLIWRLVHRQRVLPWLSVVSLVLALTAFAAVAGWALNHYAPPLAQDLGLEVREYTVDELSGATAFYLEEAARRAPEVPRDEEGTLIKQDVYELGRIAGTSYAALGERYEVFAHGSSAPVKALLLWGEPLLYSGYVGMFWAPTGEATVAYNCADADIPFSMCHEAAHRLGLASEEEANFAAYLACAASDDVRFSYAGAYNAFVYCFNKLYEASPDAAVELLNTAAASELGEGVRLVWADHRATYEHYQAYESCFEEVGDAVNEHYLQSFGETSGVRSYGLVVDYLIAWQQTQ